MNERKPLIIRWNLVDKNNGATYVCLYMLVFALNLFFKIGIAIPATTYAPINMTLKVILVLYLLYTMAFGNRKMIVVYINTAIIMSVLVLKSYILGNSDTLTLWRSYIDFLTIYIPLFACIVSVEDKNILLKKITAISYPIGIVAAATMIMYSGREIHNYDSSSSYIILIASFAIFLKYLESRNKLDLIISIVFTGISIIYGSRGALICILVFLILSFMTISRITIRQVVVGVMASFFIILLIINFESIVTLLLPKVVSSRTISALLHSSDNLSGFWDSNGRIGVWSYYWRVAKEHSLFGAGLFGCYIDLYPHNIFIEIFASEGFIVGSIIVLLLMVKQIFPMTRMKYNCPEIKLYLILSVGFSIALFSTDFLLNEWWWMFLGLCFSITRRTFANFQCDE